MPVVSGVVESADGKKSSEEPRQLSCGQGLLCKVSRGCNQALGGDLRPAGFRLRSRVRGGKLRSPFQPCLALSLLGAGDSKHHSECGYARDGGRGVSCKNQALLDTECLA